jgi:hypothetical protein
MTEKLEGRGTLRQAAPPAQWSVEYRFEATTNLGTSGGFRIRHSGIVNALNGETIQLGEYQLEAQDGKTLRVENLGVKWIILAQP